jgi:hypothetical protein
MILIVNKYLLAKGFRGVSIWPFVVMKDKRTAQDPIFINHERIHLKQQLELLILPFYIWYVVEFFFRYLQVKNFLLAYRNISFEREAYANETDFNFVRKRKFWNFRKYLFKNGN